MPTTEVVVCPLVAGSEIGNPDNSAAKVMKSLADTLAQQDGMQQLHFGTQVENPNTLQLMINWDSMEHHKTFMAANTYPPFLKNFMTVADANPSIVHVDFQPDGGLTQCLSAPVTEVATFYFNGEPPSGYLEGVEKFRDATAKENFDGFKGAAIGITHEEVERDGVKGKAAVLVVGWSSVDAHMKFRETQCFKDNVGHLRNGVGAAEMHHVALLPFAG